VNYVARQNWLINVENAAKILKKLTASAIASSIDFLALNKQQWARLRCTFAFSLFSHSFHSLSECSALYSYYLKYATQNMQNMKTWKRLCLLRVIVNFHLREKQTSKLLWKASKECHSNGFILYFERFTATLVSIIGQALFWILSKACCQSYCKIHTPGRRSPISPESSDNAKRYHRMVQHSYTDEIVASTITENLGRWERSLSRYGKIARPAFSILLRKLERILKIN